MKEIGPRDMEGGGVPDFGTANVQSFITGIVVFLPPATKLRQSNVFTLVCHSVHRAISVRGFSVQGGAVRGVSVRETPAAAVRLRASYWNAFLFNISFHGDLIGPLKQKVIF